MVDRAPADNWGYVCDVHAPRPDPRYAQMDPAAFLGRYVKWAFVPPMLQPGRAAATGDSPVTGGRGDDRASNRPALRASPDSRGRLAGLGNPGDPTNR